MPVNASLRKRLGNTLLELLVAIPVAALLGTIAVSQMLDVNKLSRSLNSETEIAREMRQAGEVLTSEIRPLAASDLIAWSDTAIEFHALIGSGVVCASSTRNTVDLLPLSGTDALRTSWFAAPQAGDNIWTIPSDTALMRHEESWQMSALSSVAAVPASSCGTLPMLTRGSGGVAERITLTSNMPRSPQAGTLVRMTRHVRYSLYKSSDGLWYLGRKSLELSGWTTIQPVAGPMRSPTSVGLRFVVRDSVANSIAFGATRTPQSVSLVMHATSRWMTSAAQYGVADSLSLSVSLRGATPTVIAP